ncbi:MAG: DUF4380 domain-containing protein [Verrucomicrobia bacterium]|nr:DUF4380 domain-containing protein [Verrucomicrobiota bacterium]
MCQPLRWLALGSVAFAGLVSAADHRAAKPKRPAAPEPAQVTVTRAPYHGWPDAIVLRNAQAEVVIVPAIGRVMQFRFLGQAGPLWENRDLDGRPPNPRATEWGNFGGDKTWPAPQAEWPRLTGRAWPPPPAFDSMPVQATVKFGVVTLVSPVDPFYGIRTHRRIELHPKKPVLTITTTYEKVAGLASRVSIWTITQLKDPVGAYLPVPEPSRFRAGYDPQSAEPPPSLKVDNGLISLTRDPRRSHKIGSDATTLLWVGDRSMLRIDTKRARGGEYPDRGCSAEIYTNGGGAAYVELEMVGPLHTLRFGESCRQTSTYTLLHRSVQDPEAEARKVLDR